MTHPFDEVALDAAREAFMYDNEEDIEVAFEAAWASLMERGLVELKQEPKP